MHGLLRRIMECAMFLLYKGEASCAGHRL